MHHAPRGSLAAVIAPVPGASLPADAARPASGASRR